MKNKKKNLLFIFSDQHRKFDLGCYGNPQVLTPNLDALAAQGARFEHCCSNSPVCVPARGTLLTGLYPQKHRAFMNDLEIRYDVESIADVLNRAGYHTGYIGKWHLCGIPRNQAIDKKRRLGFTEWKVANCNHNYLDCYYDDEEDVRHHVDGYEPEIFGSLAEDFLERNADGENPFALFVSFATPHDPHTKVGEHYKDLYQDREVTLRPNTPAEISGIMRNVITKEQQTEAARGYYAHITAIDDQVGKLLDLLKSKGQLEDTLIVYTSDHGDMLGSHGSVDKQLPYEESIAIPLIMTMKDRIPAGVREGVISMVDLSATVAGLLGLSFEQEIDGRDLHRMAEGLEEGPDDCYLHILFPCHQAYSHGYPAWRGIRTRRYTYVIRNRDQDWLLFDNEKDPYQMKNLINCPEYAELKAELHEKLRQYVEKNDGFWNGRDYIKNSDSIEAFNKSQSHFHHVLYEGLEEDEKTGKAYFYEG